MKKAISNIPPEDWFFLLGLVIVTALVVYHVGQADTVAGLVGAHKGISVMDGKFRDRISDDVPSTPPPEV